MCEVEEVTLHKSRQSWVRNGLDGQGGRKHSGAQLYNIRAIHLYYSVLSSGSMNIMLVKCFKSLVIPERNYAPAISQSLSNFKL